MPRVYGQCNSSCTGTDKIFEYEHVVITFQLMVTAMLIILGRQFLLGLDVIRILIIVYFTIGTDYVEKGVVFLDIDVNVVTISHIETFSEWSCVRCRRGS